MTDESLPATIPKSGLSNITKARNTRLGPGLSSKRILLIEEMIFNGLSRKDAAQKVGMTDRAARYALSDRVVMSAYRNSLQILRESEKPKSIHRLAELRDQSESLKVSLDAAKTLAIEEQRGPTIQLGVNVNVQPGYIVDLSKVAERSRKLLEENRHS